MPDQDRRHFLQSATLLATATGAAATAAGDVLAQATQSSAAASAPAAAHPHGTRRWIAQRWVLDNTIQANGMDWDQPRSVYLAAPCGPGAAGDFAAIRARIRKYADATPAFEAVARRREGLAKAAEESGDLVTARDNYFMATIHWAAAQWPIDANNDQNRALNQRKRECYTKYAQHADHTVLPVWIPFRGRQLPAWFHLPPQYRGGRIPAVVSIPGMDSFKEMGVALYGDRWLSRGIAVLAIDGPGQYESPILGIPFTMDGWVETGKLAYEWLAARAEVDPERIGISGNSFGSFFATIAAAHEPRYRACIGSAVCHEPGFHTIFEEASPTFKMRFMYMSGFTDEDKFDVFRRSMTWEGHADRIRMPYLCLAGEADELSPLEHTHRLMSVLKGPKRLLVYQDARHAIVGAVSANLGPNPAIHASDWMAQRFAGKPFANERWFVQATGQVQRTAY